MKSTKHWQLMISALALFAFIRTEANASSLCKPGYTKDGPVCYWLKRYGSDRSTKSAGVAVDKAGNIFTVGHTTGAVEPGQRKFGPFQAFISRFDAMGNQIWIRPIPQDNSEARGVAVYKDNSVYMVGCDCILCRDTMLLKYDYNGNNKWARQFRKRRVSDFKDVAINQSGSIYLFSEGFIVAKFDHVGNQKWIHKMKMPYAALIDDNGIAAIPQGGFYATGWSVRSFVGKCPSESCNIIVVKYDAGGAEKWVKQYGFGESNEPKAITVDLAGNIYIAGISDPNSTNESPHAMEMGIMKLDPQGKQLFATKMPFNSGHSIHGVAADKTGNVFVLGNFNYSTKAKGKVSMFLIKFDRNGKKKWEWRPKFPNNTQDYGRDIVTDQSGNVIISGITKYRTKPLSADGREDHALLLKVLSSN